MNASIISVAHLKDNPVAVHNAFLMLSSGSRKVRVTFTKKDGSTRVMTCVPKHEYNDLIGKETTEVGHRIVASKANKGMVVVTEICEPSHPGEPVTMQPRTINLCKVLSMETV